MSLGLTYPEAKDLVYDQMGLPVTHPRITPTRVYAHLWRAQVALVRHACAKGKPPVQLVLFERSNLLAQETQLAPARLYAPLRLRIADSSGAWSVLEKKDLLDMGEDSPAWKDTNTATGTPQYYYELGVNTAFNSATSWGRRQYGLSPVPTGAIVNGLEWTGVRAPLTYADFGANTTARQIVCIPRQYHEALCHRVTWFLQTNNSELPRQDYDKHAEIWAGALEDYTAECAEQSQMDYIPQFRFAVFDDRDSHWDGY